MSIEIIEEQPDGSITSVIHGPAGTETPVNMPASLLSGTIEGWRDLAEDNVGETDNAA